MSEVRACTGRERPGSVDTPTKVPLVIEDHYVVGGRLRPPGPAIIPRFARWRICNPPLLITPAPAASGKCYGGDSAGDICRVGRGGFVLEAIKTVIRISNSINEAGGCRVAW